MGTEASQVDGWPRADEIAIVIPCERQSGSRAVYTEKPLPVIAAPWIEIRRKRDFRQVFHDIRPVNARSGRAHHSCSGHPREAQAMCARGATTRGGFLKDVRGASSRAARRG